MAITTTDIETQAIAAAAGTVTLTRATTPLATTANVKVQNGTSGQSVTIAMTVAEMTDLNDALVIEIARV